MSAGIRNRGRRVRLWALAVVGAAATGLILLVYPPIVVRLLFGADIPGAGIVMSRIAGISLIALGLACWPGAMAAPASTGHSGRC